jgi:hypothetical protein
MLPSIRSHISLLFFCTLLLLFNCDGFLSEDNTRCYEEIFVRDTFLLQNQAKSIFQSFSSDTICFQNRNGQKKRFLILQNEGLFYGGRQLLEVPGETCEYFYDIWSICSE